MNTDTGSGHRGTARAFAATVAGVGGLIAVRSALPAGTPRIRLGGKADSARGITVLEKVRIGGSDQWVLERSEDVDNPVVLYMHGGPGTSQLTSNRRNTRHLEKDGLGRKEFPVHRPQAGDSSRKVCVCPAPLIAGSMGDHRQTGQQHSQLCA